MRPGASHGSHVSRFLDDLDRRDDALGTKAVPRRPEFRFERGLRSHSEISSPSATERSCESRYSGDRQVGPLRRSNLDVTQSCSVRAAMTQTSSRSPDEANSSISAVIAATTSDAESPFDRRIISVSRASPN